MSTSKSSWEFFSGTKELAKASLKQMAVLWAITNVPPYLCLILAKALLHNNKDGSFDWLHMPYHLIVGSISAGNIVFYITALIAPFIWVLRECFEERKWVPFYAWFEVAILLVIGISTLLFALSEAGVLSNIVLAKYLFCALYFISMIIWYFSIYYSKVLDAYIPSMAPDSPKAILAELEGRDDEQ